MNTTTIEQVEVLINAGLDPSTADMSYIKNPITGKYILTVAKPIGNALPCWSMGVLKEICLQKGIDLKSTTDNTEETISIMVNSIINNLQNS